MSQPIPAYDFPCLVQSTAIPSTNTTFYLIGAKDGSLELNSCDLKDINNQACRALKSDTNPRWFGSAPKLCFNYSGAGPLRTHVQQFSKGENFDANVLPTGNGTGGGGTMFEKFQGAETFASFLLPTQFAIVGQVGNSMYGVGLTDGFDSQTNSSWGSFTVVGAAQVDSFRTWVSIGTSSQKAILAVGTFQTSTSDPVTGAITVIDDGGISGTSYSTISLADSDKTVKVINPQGVQVQMKDIKLTAEAVPVHMGTTAYILDKAKDGSVTIYQIIPPTLTPIALSPKSDVPQFTASMTGSAMALDGSAMASQIVIYSLQMGKPVFNIFDMGTQTWSGPGLGKQLTPGGGNGDNGGDTGTDSGNSSSGTSNAAVIGGAVAGVLILVLIAAFFIVRRKRQRRGRGRVSQKHHLAGGQGQGGGSGGSSDLGAEEREENKPVLSDYQQQQNRASLQMAESSRGSIITLNSSSTAPLVYAPHRSSTRPTAHFAGQSQPGQPTSTPLTVPQQLQLQQQQIQQQQQQQQQQSRRGVSQGMEVLSLPAILEQHPFEQQSEGDDEELRKLEQESPFVARPYSNVPAFSYSTAYQDQPRHQHLPVRTTVINPYSGASVVDDEEQEPYVLPDPIIVAPTPVPHKAELLD